MKIVFLDRDSLGQGLDFSGYSALGQVASYGYSAPEEIPARVADAEVIITNKAPINEDTVGGAARLRLVCVTATGTNNLDKEYLARRGIAWRNVAGYSTETVAQHTFALLFYLFEHMAYYDAYVKQGRYVNDRAFSHYARTFHELRGKTWGIIGLGAIGCRVAELATAFGCAVQYYSTSGQNSNPRYPRVELDALLATSDIVSVHAPLTAQTLHLMNRQAFQKMKNTAYFINVGRGAIVVEQDLRDALEAGEIYAAGLDVLEQEPMSSQSPLLGFADSERLVITPHVAWASLEARTSLMETVCEQIRAFFA